MPNWLPVIRSHLRCKGLNTITFTCRILPSMHLANNNSLSAQEAKSIWTDTQTWTLMWWHHTLFTTFDLQTAAEFSFYSDGSVETDRSVSLLWYDTNMYSNKMCYTHTHAAHTEGSSAALRWGWRRWRAARRSQPGAEAEQQRNH